MNVRLLPSLLLLSIATSSAAQTCDVGNPLVAPDVRYALSEPMTGEFVVDDLDTGLMWKRCPEGLSGVNCDTGGVLGLDWGAALGEAEAANIAGYAGYVDWRLPNIIELRSLVETGCSAPAINLSRFPATPTLSHWSSTTVATDASKAWTVDFNRGHHVRISKNMSHRVRLVRGGQQALPAIFKDGFEDVGGPLHP